MGFTGPELDKITAFKTKLDGGRNSSRERLKDFGRLIW
jgi:hypothetical protein